MDLTELEESTSISTGILTDARLPLASGSRLRLAPESLDLTSVVFAQLFCLLQVHLKVTLPMRPETNHLQEVLVPLWQWYLEILTWV